MDFHAKHAELTAELQKTEAVRQRALRAADEATHQIAVLTGALAIVTELRDADGG